MAVCKSTCKHLRLGVWKEKNARKKMQKNEIIVQKKKTH